MVTDNNSRFDYNDKEKIKMNLKLTKFCVIPIIVFCLGVCIFIFFLKVSDKEIEDKVMNLKTQLHSVESNVSKNLEEQLSIIREEMVITQNAILEEINKIGGK